MKTSAPHSIYAYEGENLSTSLFYGARGVQQGKLGTVIYIPAVSKLEDSTRLTDPSPMRDLLSQITKEVLRASPAFAAFSEQFDQFASKIKKEKTSEDRSMVALETAISNSIGEWDMEFEFELSAPDESNIIKNLVDFRKIDRKLEERVSTQQQGFDDDIEAFLDIDKVEKKRKHRKPQHVMLRYQQSKISDDRLTVLIELVDKLVNKAPQHGLQPTP